MPQQSPHSIVIRVVTIHRNDRRIPERVTVNLHCGRLNQNALDATLDPIAV
jgi:hypothetical protein